MVTNEQPRVPAGRHDGGQFTQADKGGETQDLTATVGGDSAMVNAIVTAGAEAYVKGITAERVRAFLGTVGRDDVLSGEEAAMRLSPWSGLKNDGSAEVPKDEELGPKYRRYVEETEEETERNYLTRKEKLGQPITRFPLPRNLRLTEDGRQIALINLLQEAHDRQVFAAQRLGFSDDAAEECATWVVNYSLAEATRNLGKPDKMTFDLLATTVLSNGVEDFLTRRVPDDVKEYGAFARLGSSFEGTCRVGSDFLMYEQSLPEHTAEAKNALWDTCAKRRMEERLPDAWEAARPGIKARFGVEPDDYEAFFRPKHCLTPLEYEPAEENWKVYRDLRAKAKAGDVRAQAMMAAFDAAVKNAGRHDATLLSDGRASTPFARNRGSRKIVVPYRIHAVGVEGVRRGAYFVHTFTNGREYFEAGIAQFRERSATSLQTKVGADDNATELGDLLAKSRGGSLSGRDYAGADEIYDAGRRYASAAAIAEALPDDDKGNAKLRNLLGIDPHDGIKDAKARATAVAKDITDARAEGVPEGVIRRLWGPQLIEMTDTLIKARRDRIAHAYQEAEAAKARLRALAAQRKATQLAH